MVAGSRFKGFDLPPPHVPPLLNLPFLLNLGFRI
jgi:hypothetical protein